MSSQRRPKRERRLVSSEQGQEKRRVLEDRQTNWPVRKSIVKVSSSERRRVGQYSMKVGESCCCCKWLSKRLIRPIVSKRNLREIESERELKVLWVLLGPIPHDYTIIQRVQARMKCDPKDSNKTHCDHKFDVKVLKCGKHCNKEYKCDSRWNPKREVRTGKTQREQRASRGTLWSSEVTWARDLS